MKNKKFEFFIPTLSEVFSNGAKIDYRLLIRYFLILILIPHLFLSCKRPYPVFNETYSLNLIKKQLIFGPRYPGTEGHKKTLNFIYDELKRYTEEVEFQEFEYKRFNLTNIIAKFNYSNSNKTIILGTHYDTRKFADRDIHFDKRREPVPGANDGASGVALLLEIGRILKEASPEYNIIMVFFDAEDQGEIEGWDWCVGSSYFAQKIETVLDKNSIEYAIIVDMIGDKRLQIYKEENSYNTAPDLINKIWKIAYKFKYEEFKPNIKYKIVDDHIPLIKAGIKSVLLIDFDYPYWHTTYDTLDKVRGESLRCVGNVLLSLIYRREVGE